MGAERHIEDTWIRLLLDRAPVHAGLLIGDELILGYAVPPMLDAALGCSARESVRARLGEDWMARIDRVRRTGEPARGRASVDGATWEVSVEPLAAERVALLPIRTFS